MSEVKQVFQRLAFELKALRIDEPIEIYIQGSGYSKLIYELMNEQRMVPSEQEHEGLLIYDKIYIRHKDKLDFERKRNTTLRERMTDKLAQLALDVKHGRF